MACRVGRALVRLTTQNVIQPSAATWMMIAAPDSLTIRIVIIGGVLWRRRRAAAGGTGRAPVKRSRRRWRRGRRPAPRPAMAGGRLRATAAASGNTFATAQVQQQRPPLRQRARLHSRWPEARRIWQKRAPTAAGDRDIRAAKVWLSHHHRAQLSVSCSPIQGPSCTRAVCSSVVATQSSAKMPMIDPPVRKAFWPCVVGVLIAIGCVPPTASDHLLAVL